ncbi:MAG: hypothetical protein FWE13_01820 [Firmicutes bacterium]|nr:hypothetical protein [Bacillota bacterium]
MSSRLEIQYIDKIMVLGAIRVYYSHYRAYSLSSELELIGEASEQELNAAHERIRLRELDENKIAKEINDITKTRTKDEAEEEILNKKRRIFVLAIKDIIHRHIPKSKDIPDANKINAIIGEFLCLGYIEITEFNTFCFKLTSLGYDHIEKCEKEIFEKDERLKKIKIILLSTILPFVGVVIAIATPIIIQMISC